MDENEKKGDELVAEVNVIFESGGYYDYNKIVDQLTKATINYKKSKSWLKAANTFLLLGDLHLSNSYNSYRAACCYNKAGENFLLLKDLNAKICFDKAAKLFIDDYKYNSAAKILAIVGDLLNEQKLSNEAINYYVKAYDYYCLEKSTGTGIVNLSKAAYLLLECNYYREAIKYLEIIFNYHICNNFAAVQCKELLLDIGIVDLCLQDLPGCQSWMTSCKKYGLEGCREFVYLAAFADAYNNKEPNIIDALINEYVTVKPLNCHIVKCLQHIKTIL